MNEQIAKIYDKALIIESNGDYVAGELDPVKFAELIVRECVNICMKNQFGGAENYNNGSVSSAEFIKQHFGVE